MLLGTVPWVPCLGTVLQPFGVSYRDLTHLLCPTSPG